MNYDQIKKATHAFESEDDKQWNSKYKTGDEWVDSNQKKWRKDGYQTRTCINKRKIGPLVPFFCPQCGKGIRKVDEPSIFAKSVCLDCEILIEWEEQKKELEKLNKEI